jgi:hypothetical protein
VKKLKDHANMRTYSYNMIINEKDLFEKTGLNQQKQIELYTKPYLSYHFTQLLISQFKMTQTNTNKSALN